MPSTSSDSITAGRPSSNAPTRFSRRMASDVARSLMNESRSKESPPMEPPRKRPRNTTDSAISGTRKSVTVIVKSQGTEEFHSPSSSVIQPSSTGSSKNGLVMPQPLKPDASSTDKVIAVINFLRDRRRRPDEKIVILYSERMYQLSSTETKAALQSLVEKCRIFPVNYPSGVSYRYHMSIVARGDTVAQRTNKIRAKYAVHVPKSNGTAKTSTCRATNSVNATFSGVEMTALKSFLRLILPSGCVVRPPNLTPNGDCSVMDKIHTVSPHNALGEDATQSEPGVSAYVLPPPTPVSLETVEKALRSLPHMALIGNSSRSSAPQHIECNDVRSENPNSSPYAFKPLKTPGLLASQSIVSDPAMSILLRRRPSEGFTELWIRSPGSTLRNAFTLQVLSELTEALRLVEADNEIRAVVISGVGRVFSSGIDLPALSASSATTVDAFVDSLVTALRAFLLKLSAFPKLLVVGVNGPAEGLATAILPLFDLVYASDIATFHLAYTTLGQVPEAGSTFTLARRVGSPLANDLILAGRRLSAREALQRGLVSDLLFPKNFPQEIILRCARIAGQSASALETTKCLSRLCDREHVEFMITAECHRLAQTWKTLEFRVAAAHYVQHCMNDFI